MKYQPYSKFCSDKLILRDELAIDRTLLANKRTLLSYLRSAVGLLIAGVSIMQFSAQEWFWLIGVICMPVGIAAGIIGIVRFKKMNRSIAGIRSLARPDQA